MNHTILSTTLLGLLLSAPVHSDSIYKCTKNDNSVSFTDKPCPANSKATLIHKESEQEVQNRLQADKQATIKNLIEGEQTNAAKEYALKNNLSDYYYSQLSIHANEKVEEEKRQAEDNKQQQLAIEQQKLALQRQQLNAQSQQQTSNHGYNSSTYPYYGTSYTPYYGSVYYSSPYYGTSHQSTSYLPSNRTNVPQTFEQRMDQKLYGIRK